jgi:calcium-dependent protein kinase
MGCCSSKAQPPSPSTSSEKRRSVHEATVVHVTTSSSVRTDRRLSETTPPVVRRKSSAGVAEAGSSRQVKSYGEVSLPEFDPSRGTGTPGAVTVKTVGSIKDIYEILPTSLGKGSFGEVMLARRIADKDLADPPLFAVKKLKPDIRAVSRSAAKRVVMATKVVSKIGAATRALNAVKLSSAASGTAAAAAAIPVTTVAPEPTALPPPSKELPRAAEPSEAKANPAVGTPSLSAVVTNSKMTAHLEADIMNRVRGDQHVVNLVDIVEDPQNVYIVMEYCRGGDLMKYVVRCSHFSEKVASYLFRQMLLGVAFCHSRGVVHRDLKPENFLFASTEGKAELKIADFGLATEISTPDEEIIDGVGSAFFIAPEVLQRRYTSACDVWSLGVNLYLLLSGAVPFGAKATKATEVYRSIRKDALTFSGPAWSQISPSARELVSGLLEKQPFRRYTIAQALAHPWVTSDGVAPDTPLDSSIVRAMTHFNAKNRLRREALRLVSSTLSADDLKALASQFHTIDTDADMVITYSELAAAMRKMGLTDSKSEDEVLKAMEAMDADNDGTIDLQEFLAATSELQMIEHQNNIWWAFCQYDKNGDGTITIDELRAVLKGEAEDKIQEYIREYDVDRDGRISYEEFIRMLVPPDMEFTTIRY